MEKEKKLLCFACSIDGNVMLCLLLSTGCFTQLRLPRSTSQIPIPPGSRSSPAPPWPLPPPFAAICRLRTAALCNPSISKVFPSTAIAPAAGAVRWYLSQPTAVPCSAHNQSQSSSCQPVAGGIASLQAVSPSLPQHLCRRPLLLFVAADCCALVASHQSQRRTPS